MMALMPVQVAPLQPFGVKVKKPSFPTAGFTAQSGAPLVFGTHASCCWGQSPATLQLCAVVTLHCPLTHASWSNGLGYTGQSAEVVQTVVVVSAQ
jgi:hypothetical protein